LQKNKISALYADNGLIEEEQTHENHISYEDVMKERSASVRAADPLSSWAEGPAKLAIVQFVQSVTEKDGKDYAPPEERIATFDNDGTLCVEYPLYTQLLFASDRVKELAPKHPEWKTKQPFKALLEGDMQMIEYTTGAEGRRLGLFLHHTDGVREFAYDRKSYVGTLDKALGQAEANGWIIVDMKNDWKRVFAFEGME